MASRGIITDIRTAYERRLDNLRCYWRDLCDKIAEEQAETNADKKVALSLEIDRMTENYAKADLLNGNLINIPIYLT